MKSYLINEMDNYSLNYNQHVYDFIISLDNYNLSGNVFNVDFFFFKLLSFKLLKLKLLNIGSNMVIRIISNY